MSDIKRGERGKLLPGQKSLNPNGRPKSLKTLEREAEKLMQESDIEFNGDILKYIEDNIAARVASGAHRSALELAIKILPYKHPRIQNIASEGSKSSEISISFEGEDEGQVEQYEGEDELNGEEGSNTLYTSANSEKTP